MVQPNEERSKILQMISGYLTAYLSSIVLLAREQTILNTILHNMVMREILHLSVQELDIPDISVSNVISNSHEKFVESILDNSSNYMELICTMKDPLNDIRESLKQDNLFIQLLFYEKIAKLLKENLEDYVNQAESHYEFPLQGTFKRALAYSIFQDVLPEGQDVTEPEEFLRELGRSVIDVLNYLLLSVKSVTHVMYEPLRLLQKSLQNSLVFRSMPATRFYITLLTLYHLMDNASRMENRGSPASLFFVLHNHEDYRLTYELSLETIKDIILSALQKSALCMYFCREMCPCLRYHTEQDFTKIMRGITDRINLLLEQRSSNAINKIKDGIMRVLNDPSNFHYLLREVESMERNGITEDVIRKIEEEARFNSLSLHNVCGRTVLYSILKYISSFCKRNHPNRKELDEKISSVRNCINYQNDFLILGYVVAALCSGNLPIPHLKANVENNRENPVIDDVDLLVLSLKPSTSTMDSDIASIGNSVEPLKLVMYLIEVSTKEAKLLLHPESLKGFLIDSGDYLSKKIDEYEELYESGNIWNSDLNISTIFLVNINLEMDPNLLERSGERNWNDVYCISPYPPVCLLKKNHLRITIADAKEFLDPLLFNWLLWVSCSDNWEILANDHLRLNGINKLFEGSS